MSNIYNSNPNQKNITVNKAPTNDIDEKNFYAKINLLALKNAMHDLTPKAFELWIYFSKNQDKYKFYLSKVDFLSWANIKSSSYSNGIAELVEKKYLIPKDKENPEPKTFDFFEIPRDDEEFENIEITVNKNGFYF